jgi:hypothetical protein
MKNKNGSKITYHWKSNYPINIHILPTEQSSRLLRAKSNGNIFLGHHKDFIFDAENWEYLNIYITSKEPIKEGDWCVCIVNEKITRIMKVSDVSKDDFWFVQNGRNVCLEKENCKKIILTTDQDLIEDVVQSINDEFLEWFVENPTCEFVEVTRDFADEGVKGITHYGKYFITIPQEDKNNENTTLNDLITNTLKGKSVIVYEYDALFVLTNNFVSNNRRISHWYINDNEENRIPYGLKTHWDDLQIKKHVGTIVSVSGYHMDYEGTSITMVVNVDGSNKHINLHMENTMELVS